MRNLEKFKNNEVLAEDQKEINGGQTVNDHQEGLNIENYAFTNFRWTTSKTEIYRKFCGIYNYGLNQTRQRGGSEYWFNQGWLDGVASRNGLGIKGCA